ncbi:fimbrial biogenesis chaperone [Kitasatospora sp. NPDC001095]
MAIALDRTRVIFDGGNRPLWLNISNENKELPYLVQGWLEDDNGKKISSPLMVLPPLQRVEPGTKSQIKVQATPATAQLPRDRETLYYFNIREIPPKSTKPNTLQIALQTRFKLFYRPTPLAADGASQSAKAAQDLQMSWSGRELTVSNPSAYYVTVADLTVGGGKSIEPFMIAPFGSKTCTPASTDGQIQWTYINDTGAPLTVSR